MKSKVLFYHKGCPDGFGAAWAFRAKFGSDIEFRPITHKEGVGDVTGRDIYFADIAPTAIEMSRIISEANSVYVIDHHVTSKNILSEFPEYCYFDMTKSGAVLSWEHLFDKEIPLLLKLIGEQDLYKYESENAREILAYISTVQFEFSAWDDLQRDLSENLEELTLMGSSILKSRNRSVLSAAKKGGNLVLDGHTIFASNSILYRSEVANMIALRDGIGASYFISNNKVKFSIRSTDLSNVYAVDIAEAYAGGGHKHAAGFEVELNILIDMLNG